MAIFCHEAAHVTTEWKENINFWSYSPVNVRPCGNIYYIFSHIHHENVRHCQFFNHVHQGKA